ncbi:MAG: pilus assembly protein [Desulfobacterium sp.]|nr:pilus assembly protein [Desulfobacterium sp.]MBU3947285.1 pilus assembly protein [Pseudomonadota bacterium]MBU4036415.1 pilus assembly protein [Pseudomonadota bacterium]
MSRLMRVKNQNGVAAVEFALILPILIVLILGIVEFSIMLYDKAVLTNASREGARAGIVAQTPRVTQPEIKAVVDNYCKTYLITFKAGIVLPATTVTWEGFNFGDDLSVTVTYDYTFLALPNFIAAITGVKTLTATTVMRME